MKKFFYSTLAVLALVGCGKIETPSVDFVDNNKPAEIGFSSQATFGTKAVVSGTALPSDAKFSVFADFKEDGTLSEANYLYNAEYGSDGQPTGTDKYYWPVSDKTVTLDFYAIYPSATDYARSNNSVTVNVDCQKVNADCVDVMLATATGQEYDESDGKNDLKFEHQLSYVSFKAKKQDLAGFTEVKLTALTVTVPISKGTIAFKSNTDATLTETEDTEYTYTVNASTLELSTDLADCGYFLAIPQGITINDGAKAKITYTYKDIKGNVHTNTVDKISLQSKAQEKWSTWAPSTHYIYDITIGLKEILFSVTVKDWTSGGEKELY